MNDRRLTLLAAFVLCGIAITGVAMTFAFFMMNESGTERLVGILYPFPHLIYLVASLRMSMWWFAALQLLLYGSVISTLRCRMWIRLGVLLIIHVLSIAVHLGVRGLVP